MAVRIQLRRDTAANWVSSNPTLRAGEIGIETDTLKFKIGNGTETWTQITAYANITPSSLDNSLSEYILVADQGAPGGPAELNSNGDLIIPENSIVLWNDSLYDYTTTFTATEPTADRTITLPNADGTLAFISDVDLKAPLDSPTFTGTVSGITSATVGLGSVDNTSDASKPVSTATQTALDLKAPLASPNLTGTPVAPTAAANTNTAQVATTAFVSTAISNLINSAPGALDTLGELAAALQADESTAASLATLVGTKAPLDSPTFTGTVSGITSATVGLGSVDNTSDASKPVSTATQTALDAKIAKTIIDAKGDLLVGSADDTVGKLTVGTNGYLLTANSSATNGVEWAAAPVSLPSQTGNLGKYLTTDGSVASWGTLVVPIETGTVSLTANTATTIDTTALESFTSIEYMVSLKQGSKIRTSKVVVQTDGTSVDMTEFAITETGGALSGVVVSSDVSTPDGVLQVTVTDASSTNVTVKFSKITL